MAGSLPSGETREASASTRCHAGLSRRALLLECTSFRGPRKDVHPSNKARLDSPAWHLVEALASLVSPDGNDPAIEGYTAKVRPLSDVEKKMITEAAHRMNEAEAKKLLGVQHWVRDVSFQESLELLVSRPTVNIEGI